MAENNSQRLASFASLDELVEFIDTNDMGEYENDLPQVHFDVGDQLYNVGGYSVNREEQSVNNEVTEIAKATQEVAKTTRTGIEAAQKFGSFLGRVLGEPIETAVGMVSDRLSFMRIERRMRLADRYAQIMIQRGVSSEEQPVPPKIAVPAIENASLEENDELQDLWANLLASAHDKTLNGVVRSAFVDIIKQLEVVDVHILNFIYSDTMQRNLTSKSNWKINLSWEPRYEKYDNGDPVLFGVRQFDVQNSLQISRHIYECAVDNLVRVRCLSPYVEDVDVSGEYPETVSRVHEYQWVSITRFGCDFVRCCTLPLHTGANKE